MAETRGQSSSIGLRGDVTGNIQTIIGQQNIEQQIIINFHSRHSTRQHLNEPPPEFINLLPPEVRSAVQAGVGPIPEMERSVHSGDDAPRRSRSRTAAPEHGARASQSSAPAFSVDGAEGAIFLYNLRETLKRQGLTEAEVKKMFDAFDVGRSSGQRPCDVDELFRVLMETRRLREDDVIYLQCLLWVAGRIGVMEVVAAEARLQQQDYKRNVSHLRSSVAQRNGYRNLRFHLNVPTLGVTAERLRELETTVAALLGVPLDFVAVAEVNLESSAWVSVMVPEEAYKTLVDALHKEEVQQFFVALGVDKIAYDRDIADVKPATPTADAEEKRFRSKKRKRGDVEVRQTRSTKQPIGAGRANGKENVQVLPPSQGATRASPKRRKTTRASAAMQREEDDEDAVVSILKSQLDRLTRSRDPPAYIFHGASIVKGKKHVIVLHHNMGLIIVQVERLTSQLNTFQAAENLKHAREVMDEVTGQVLDNEDIVTAIAAPNLQDPGKASQGRASEPTVHILPGKSEASYREWLQRLASRSPATWSAKPDLYKEVADRIVTWHKEHLKM